MFHVEQWFEQVTYGKLVNGGEVKCSTWNNAPFGGSAPSMVGLRGLIFDLGA